MSWNGMKPTLSKEEVRGLLPGAACKSTVYLVRVFLTRQHNWKDFAFKKPCTRCGVTIDFEALARKRMK